MVCYLFVFSLFLFGYCCWFVLLLVFTLLTYVIITATKNIVSLAESPTTNTLESVCKMKFDHRVTKSKASLNAILISISIQRHHECLMPIPPLLGEFVFNFWLIVIGKFSIFPPIFQNFWIILRLVAPLVEISGSPALCHNVTQELMSEWEGQNTNPCEMLLFAAHAKSAVCPLISELINMT